MGRKSREKTARRRETASLSVPVTAPDVESAPEGSQAPAPLPPAPSPRWRRVLAELWVYVAVSVPFWLLKAYTATPSSGDENIYYYVGTRVAEGVTPYVDILFAHPPGHLLISTLWMALGSYTPLWGKLASIVPAFLALLVVVRILRGQGVSRSAACVAGLLLATSYNYLSVSSHFTGANWSMLWVSCGLWAVVARRPRAAGALLALALLTSTHVAPAVIGIALAGLILNPRRDWRVAGVAFAILAGVHLFCLVVFGDPYYNQVFGYHAAKTPMSEGGLTSIIRFFHNEYLLATLAGLGLITWAARFLGQMGGRPLSHALRIGLGLLALAQVLEAAANGVDAPKVLGVLLAGGSAAAWTWWERRQTRDAQPEPLKTWPLAFIAGGAALAQTAGVFAIDRVFTYYQSPLLPLFALLAGWLVHELALLVGEIRADYARREPVGGRVLALGVLFLIGLSAFVLGERLERRMGYYQREAGQVFHYAWQDSPALPGFLNGAVRLLFFKSERRVGDVEWGISRYLWHEMHTEDPSGLLPYFSRFSSLPGTIFGDASTTGYYALMTGRRIALEMADTNAQLFKSGLIDMNDVLARFAPDPPLFLVMNPARGVGGHPLLKRYAAEQYRLLAREQTVDKQTLLLYVRRDATP